MKYLFEIDNQGQVEFAPQILAIKEFRELWNKRLPNVDIAVAEMSIIFFLKDIRSPYMKNEEETRLKEILLDIMPDNLKWKPDKYTEAAMEKYVEMSRTASMDSLESAWISQRKIDAFLRTVDLNEKDKNGKLVHNVKQIQMMMKDLPNSIKALQVTQRLVMTEMNEDLELQAGREKAEFEDAETNA
jgi:hypothetical protein